MQEIQTRKESHQLAVMERFVALSMSTVAGVFATVQLLSLSIIFSPLFQFFTSAVWLVAAINHAYKCNERDIEVSMLQEVSIGLLSGAMISTLVVAGLLINPASITFAAAACALTLAAGFLYAKLNKEADVSHLQRQNILHSVGLTSMSVLFVSLGLYALMAITGSPVFMLIDAIAFGVLAAAGLLANMHYILNDADGTNSTPSYDAFRLFTDSLSLFIEVIRAKLAYDASKESNVSFKSIASVGLFFLGSLYILYHMLSGTFFKPAAAQAPHGADAFGDCNDHGCAHDLNAHRVGDHRPGYVA